MKLNTKGYIISALKKQITDLKETIWDDNRMIAHYDNDIKKLQKRVKALEEEYATEEEAMNFAIVYEAYELPTDKPGVCQGCEQHCKFSAAFLAAWNEKCVYAKNDITVIMED